MIELRGALLEGCAKVLAAAALLGACARIFDLAFDPTTKWLAGAGLPSGLVTGLLLLFGVTVLGGRGLQKVVGVRRVEFLGLALGLVAMADGILSLRRAGGERPMLLAILTACLLLAWVLHRQGVRRSRPATRVGPWEKLAERSVQIRRPV